MNCLGEVAEKAPAKNLPQQIFVTAHSHVALLSLALHLTHPAFLVTLPSILLNSISPFLVISSSPYILPNNYKHRWTCAFSRNCSFWIWNSMWNYEKITVVSVEKKLKDKCFIRQKREQKQTILYILMEKGRAGHRWTEDGSGGGGQVGLVTLPIRVEERLSLWESSSVLAKWSRSWGPLVSLFFSHLLQFDRFRW